MIDHVPSEHAARPQPACLDAPVMRATARTIRRWALVGFGVAGMLLGASLALLLSGPDDRSLRSLAFCAFVAAVVIAAYTAVGYRDGKSRRATGDRGPVASAPSRSDDRGL